MRTWEERLGNLTVIMKWFPPEISNNPRSQVSAHLPALSQAGLFSCCCDKRRKNCCSSSLAILTWQSWVRSLLGGLQPQTCLPVAPHLSQGSVCQSAGIFLNKYFLFLNSHFKMSEDFGQMKCWPSEDIIVMAAVGRGMMILSALNTRLISVTDPLLSRAAMLVSAEC